MENTLSIGEKERYSRHLIIPQVGEEGQLKLKNAKVLCVGAGGLGSPLLLYLVAAGVGTIGIVEGDTIDKSNLQRQILYSESQIGLKKNEMAKKRLNDLNPDVKINIHDYYLSSENAIDTFKEYDIIADGSDNFPTRYLVNDACVLTNKTNVFASIYRFEGQLTVFNAPNGEKRSANYRDLFPTPPEAGTVPSCAEAGVLGVLPGIIGSLQANEVIKCILGIGEPLIQTILTIDSLTLNTQKIKYRKRKNTTITKLIDYEQFCGLKQNKIQSISIQELKKLNLSNATLLDVRENFEVAISKIENSLHIPLNEISQRASELPKNQTIYCYCKAGIRSEKAIDILKDKGFTKLINIEGGIDAYNKQ